MTREEYLFRIRQLEYRIKSNEKRLLENSNLGKQDRRGIKFDIVRDNKELELLRESLKDGIYDYSRR